jgi:chitinase
VDQAAVFDQLNIEATWMAWDGAGWLSWHNSPLHGETTETPSSISLSVDAYLAAGMPAARLGIGVAFFGACYTAPVTGPRQILGPTTEVIILEEELSYTRIMEDYAPSGTASWDAVAYSPYLSFTAPTGAHACTYLSYDDARSIGEKAAYVAAEGLGGTAIWFIPLAYFPLAPVGSRDPLMDAVAAEFLGR